VRGLRRPRRAAGRRRRRARPAGWPPGGEGIQEERRRDAGGLGQEERGARDGFGQRGRGGAAAQFARESFAGRVGGQQEAAREVEREGAVAHHAGGIAHGVVEQQRQRDDADEHGQADEQEDGPADGLERGEAGDGQELEYAAHAPRRASGRRAYTGS
jgi:hypothetical protein